MEEKTETSGISNWIKDNLRVIISVAIVVAIAGGIYSYSKRTQAPVGEEEQMIGTAEEMAEEAEESEEAKITAPEEKQEEKVPAGQITASATSKETGESFIETAGKGDGTTHLARRALANYLEKNPDSTLTPEHKIYIEDYLRKHAGFTGRVYVGTSVEFSKDLVSQAIEQSKKLNENQLNNLHKYAVMVPSLS